MEYHTDLRPDLVLDGLMLSFSNHQGDRGDSMGPVMRQKQCLQNVIR